MDGSLHKRLKALRAQRHLASPSRRQFIKSSAAAAAGLMALPIGELAAQPIARLASFSGMPRPIPGGVFVAPRDTTLHFYFPTRDNTENIIGGQGDPSTITDFEGTVGIFEYHGGTGTEIVDGVETMRYTAVDVRFMSGRYIDMEGEEREGTFTFL